MLCAKCGNVHSFGSQCPPATSVSSEAGMLGETYRGRPGFVAGSDTSEEAANSMIGPAQAWRQKVYDLVKARETGYTCDEIEAEQGWPHTTVSARLRELELRGLLIKTPEKRRTRSGRKARVYRG